MNNLRKTTALLIALMVALSLSPAMANAADTGKHVDLVWYQVGNSPADIQAVTDQINALLGEKINAGITINFTTWSDWTTKYNLVLSSGEPCDLIYTATWINYAALARQEAFQPLDDLLPKYAPDVWSLIPEITWNQMRVDKTIYSIPSSREEYNGGGIIYREDLRAKYDLPVPNTVENTEAYALGVKANEPDQPLVGEFISTGSFATGFGAFSVFMSKYPWVNGEGPIYGLAADYNNPTELTYYWDSLEFRDDMKVLKRWADEGFWSRSVLSQANDSNAFNNGQAVLKVAGNNPSKYIGIVSDWAVNHPDWQAGYALFADETGVAFANPPAGNGTAVPFQSKNPDRALMALNLLYTDPQLHYLIQYGIEGEHYTIDSDGYYTPGPKNESYGHEGSNTWNLRNPAIGLTRRSDVELNAQFDHLKGIVQKTKFPGVDIASGFIENYDGYSAERAALATVIIEYLAPIQAGLVSDVDAAIDEFLVKAKDAGIEKIHTEYTAQWEAYCSEYNYK